MGLLRKKKKFRKEMNSRYRSQYKLSHFKPVDPLKYNSSKDAYIKQMAFHIEQVFQGKKMAWMSH